MEINKIYIEKNFDSLYKGENITGEIFFTVKDEIFHFPEKNWNDFVVILLEWWLDALIKLKSNYSSVTLNFMDGPFFVTVAKDKDDILTLEFVHDGENQMEILKTINIKLRQFENSLLSTSNLLINELKIRKWVTEETIELEKKYTLLKNINKLEL